MAVFVDGFHLFQRGSGASRASPSERQNTDVVGIKGEKAVDNHIEGGEMRR